MKENNKVVEFVSYDGKFPNLCSGRLVLRINGQVRELPDGCLCSGGCVWFDDDWGDHVEHGDWTVVGLPKDLELFQTKIEECVNENIPQGCCGGCV